MDVLAIFGPTAVGKSAVAAAVVARLGERGEPAALVSADALQVYRGLERLSGAADSEATGLVSFVPVTEQFSAGAYAELAHAEIDRLLADGVTPIVVGGTGLYLRAALADLTLGPPADPALRAALLDEYDRLGGSALHARLAASDPAAAARIAPADRQRVTRALELAASGHPQPRGDELWTAATRHPTRLIGLTMEREALNARIDARVDAMVAAGAQEEVRQADAAGASDTARKALGFDELLRGDVAAMKARTRRYAKRQMTWLRKLPAVELIDVTGRDVEAVSAEIVP